MKLLFDQNISFRIIKLLDPVFPDCLHVSRSGLPQPATDPAIWQYAKVHRYAIVTNDEDFVNLESLFGFPPKVVHLRFGNASTPAIARKLQLHAVAIQEFLDSPKHGVLEIF